LSVRFAAVSVDSGFLGTCHAGPPPRPYACDC